MKTDALPSLTVGVPFGPQSNQPHSEPRALASGARPQFSHGLSRASAVLSTSVPVRVCVESGAQRADGGGSGSGSLAGMSLAAKFLLNPGGWFRDFSPSQVRRFGAAGSLAPAIADQEDHMKRSRLRSQYRILATTLLLAASALVADASVIITNPAGLTTKTFNSSGSDGAGDTISISPGIFFNSISDGEVVACSSGCTTTVTFTFASPLETFGFDLGDFGSASITAVTLSNADALTTSLPHSLSENNFYGITSGSDFTSASVTFNVPDSFDIKDFRLGPAAGAPEPATLALVAPLLLAGLAGLRLRKRGIR